MSTEHEQRPVEQPQKEFEQTFDAWVQSGANDKPCFYSDPFTSGAWAAWRCRQERIDELQAILDWMKANNDLVYHFIGVEGEDFIDRVRSEMAKESAKELKA